MTTIITTITIILIITIIIMMIFCVPVYTTQLPSDFDQAVDRLFPGSAIFCSHLICHQSPDRVLVPASMNEQVITQLL